MFGRSALPADVQVEPATEVDGVDVTTFAALLETIPLGVSILDVATGLPVWRNRIGKAQAGSADTAKGSDPAMMRSWYRQATADGGTTRGREIGNLSLDICAHRIHGSQEVVLVVVSDHSERIAAEQQAQAFRTRLNEIHDVDADMQAAALATEQTSASIRQIATNAADASATAQSAVEIARGTAGAGERLGDASAEISKFVKVIESIAAQTNLLALNATIEAARAGEAGRGFAIVANEVKDLARGTAEATEKIGHMIDKIQEETTGAVSAMNEIVSVIEGIYELQRSIAVAVEDQTEATSAIATNVTSAAGRAGSIAEFLRAADR
jgi:hypothetical protein